MPRSSVVDHSVSSGLVTAIVATTAPMACEAIVRRTSRIAGASCAIVSSPEKARNAAAYPVMRTSGVSAGPCVSAVKLWMMPAGPSQAATASTTRSWPAPATTATAADTRALSRTPSRLSRPRSRSASTVTGTATG